MCSSSSGSVQVAAQSLLGSLARAVIRLIPIVP